MREDPVFLCAELIRESNQITALTGAGISTKAGFPDFRGPQGLYVTRKYDPDKIFNIEFFNLDPKPFFDFARDFINLENKIETTFTHRFLFHLEKKEKLIGIVTQNIDSLHQKAGSTKVLEMHGSFWLSHCLICYAEYSYEVLKQKLLTQDIPLCSCGGVIKPDIIFFGENVKYLHESTQLAEQSDLFFVIGTSCVVYPAAILPAYSSGKIVVINLSRVELQLKNVVLNIQEDIDEFFVKVEKILNKHTMKKA